MIVVILPIALLLTILAVEVYCNCNLQFNDGKISEKSLFTHTSYAVVIFYAFLWTITEIGSIFSNIRYPYLVTVWTVYIIVMCCCLFKYRRSQVFGVLFGKFFNRKFVIASVFAIIIIAYAVITVPYNWDSFTYHLPRVMEWAQSGSIRHFASDYQMQLQAQPFAEYVLLNIYVLSGYRDLFLNLSQCVAFLISMVILYNIMLNLDLERNYAGLGILLFAACPAVFGEALTTQNDIVATIFVICFCDIMLQIGRNIDASAEKRVFVPVIFAGLCAGLSVITKYYCGFAVGIYVLVFVLHYRKNILQYFFGGVVGLFSAVIVFLPESVRLLRTFGSIFPPDISTGLIVTTINPLKLFVNFIKNFSNLLPNNYIYKCDDILYIMCNAISNLLGVDFYDKSISAGNTFYLFSAFNYHHDRAAAPLIGILSLAVLVIMIISFAKGCKSKHGWFIVGSVAAFFSFQIFTKYVSFRIRYELCFIAFMCPVIVFFIKNGLLKTSVQIFFKGAIICFCVCDLLSLFVYHGECIVRQGIGDRPYGYYLNSENEYNQFCDLMTASDPYEDGSLGINFAPGLPEYWVWVCYHDNEIRCVQVDNSTSKYEKKDYSPKTIIIGTFGDYEYGVDETFKYNNNLYRVTYKDNIGSGYYVVAKEQ